MKYRPGWTVFHLPSTLVPSARVPLAAAAAVGVVGDHSAACTRVLLPVAVVLVSSSAPRSSASFGCRRLSEWPAHAQRRAVAPPRRLLVSLGLLLVVVQGNRRRFHGLAEPTVAACLRQCPTTSLSSAAMFCSSLPGTVGAPVCLHSAI